MKKVILALSVSVGGLLTSGAGAAMAEEVWRYFIADHEQAQITVVEVGKDAIVWDRLAEPARLHLNHDGRLLFAVQRNKGRVDMAETGFRLEDHGDHEDLHVEDAAWQGLFLTGSSPTHFVVHGRDVAAFMDGTGSVAKVNADAYGEAFDVTHTVTAAPHHGVAVPLHDHMLLTSPNLEDPGSLPNHVQVLDAVGEQLGDLHQCSGLHGEASSMGKVAFACLDGLLVFDESDLSQSTFLPYPKGLGEGRSGRLDGGKTVQFFAGNFGKDQMIFIDVESGGTFQSVQFDAPLVSGYLNPSNSGEAFAHTADGKLHKIDAFAAEIVMSVDATAPVDMEQPWYAARPNFTFAGDNIALVEPLASALKLISTDDLAVLDVIDVAGKPYSIVAAGGHFSDH
jgi:hypothetical protein